MLCVECLVAGSRIRANRASWNDTGLTDINYYTASVPLLHELHAKLAAAGFDMWAAGKQCGHRAARGLIATLTVHSVRSQARRSGPLLRFHTACTQTCCGPVMTATL